MPRFPSHPRLGFKPAESGLCPPAPTQVFQPDPPDLLSPSRASWPASPFWPALQSQPSSAQRESIPLPCPLHWFVLMAKGL